MLLRAGSGRAAPEDYGAVGDGAHDDRSAIEAAAHGLGETGGVVSLASDRVYYVSRLDIPANVTIEGALTQPDNPGGSNASIEYGKLGGLALSSIGTIRHGANAGLRNLLVKRAGMTFPASDTSHFAGQALTWTADGAHDRNVTILGFGRCLGETGPVSRYVLSGFYCDGIDGEWIDQPSYDSSTIRDVHNWPFSNSNLTSGPALTRSGEGLHLSGAQDDTRIDNVLSYGYAIGFNLVSTGAVSIGKIWADYPVQDAAASGSIGVKVGAGTTGVAFDQVWIFSTDRGLVTAMDVGTRIKIGIAHIEATTGDAIAVEGGDVSIAQLEAMRIGGYALDIRAPSSHVAVRGTIAAVRAREPVAAPPGAVSDNLDIDLASEKADGLSMIGVNKIGFMPVASGTTLNLPASGRDFTVTGSSSIKAIAAPYGGREVKLHFEAPLTVEGGGNVALAGAAPFAAKPGAMLALEYDGLAQMWREEWRSSP